MVADVETAGGKGGQFVIQLAFLVLNETFKEIKVFNQYIRLPPDKRYINPNAQSVHHITLDMLDKHGIDPKEALSVFFNAVSDVKKQNGKVIFHNASFDSKAIQFTAETIGYTTCFPFTANYCFCTMKESKARLGLTDKLGRSKNPKNTELYEYLVGPVPSGTKLHDALEDIRLTASSFEAGVRRAWW